MLWSSCVRDRSFRDRLTRDWELLAQNERPSEGDLVVAHALANHGAYTAIETPTRRFAPLRTGTAFVGVLGTRRSGTNLTAELPSGPLKRGDVLGLAAVGGLVASVVFTPRYCGSAPLPLGIDGFFRGPQGKPVNLRDGQTIPPGRQHLDYRYRTVMVAGTSAESGKTTLMCQLLRMAHRMWPGLTLGAVKVCGTGRMADLRRYRRGGAKSALDFVTAGWPTTYNMSDEQYSQMLRDLLTRSFQAADVVFIEVGGDLLEGHAPDALAAAAVWPAPVILCVNDALGALAGLRLLDQAGVHCRLVSALRQNQVAMARRLEVPAVLDPFDDSGLREVLAKLVHPHVACSG